MLHAQYLEKRPSPIPDWYDLQPIALKRKQCAVKS